MADESAATATTPVLSGLTEGQEFLTPEKHVEQTLSGK